MTKKISGPTRLPGEIIDTGVFYICTEYHPETAAPYAVRIFQKGPYDEKTYDLLDNMARLMSKSMQRPHEAPK